MAPPLFFTEVETVTSSAASAADLYQVVGVHNIDAQFAAPVELYLTLNDNLSFTIMRGLNNGLTITIPIVTVETIGEGNLVAGDFTVERRTTLERYKRRKLHKVRSIFTLYLSNIGSISFFNMFNAFAGLADQGYFITDANREEKYLEIIALNDPNLISLLEDYLEAYDLVSPIANMWTNVKTFEADLEVATNQAEVDAAAHLFDTA
jgi:hypothetical protein